MPTGRLRLTRSPAASPCRKAPFSRARLSRPGRNQPDRGLSEGIIDDLLLDQDECSTGRALCGDAGVALPVHLIEPISDPGRHALLKALRCAAKGKASQPRLWRPKRRELGPHGAVDDMEQVTGEAVSASKPKNT